MTAAMEAFARVEGLAATDVAEGSLHGAVLANGTRLCVGRHEGVLFAMKDFCTHAEFPLSEGSLLPTGEVECCWHGARFDCRSGAVRRGPAEDDLSMWEVEEREGAIYARRPPRNAA